MSLRVQYTATSGEPVDTLASAWGIAVQVFSERVATDYVATHNVLFFGCTQNCRVNFQTGAKQAPTGRRDGLTGDGATWRPGTPASGASADGRWGSLSARGKDGVPVAHCAPVPDRRETEIERGGTRVRSGTSVVPVEDVLAERGVPAGSWC